MRHDGSGRNDSFVHSPSRYSLSSASERGDVMVAAADAKADYGPAFKELTVLEGFSGDICSCKRNPDSK